MNIHKLGASQAAYGTQSGANAKGLAGAAPKSAPTIGGTTDAPNARIASFQRHVDRRLDSVMHQDGLSDRQLRALEETKRKFDGMMRRLDGAMDDGHVDGAMSNILQQLGTAIHSILDDAPTAQDANAGGLASSPSSPNGSTGSTSARRGIDTLA